MEPTKAFLDPLAACRYQLRIPACTKPIWYKLTPLKTTNTIMCRTLKLMSPSVMVDTGCQISRDKGGLWVCLQRLSQEGEELESARVESRRQDSVLGPSRA